MQNPPAASRSSASRMSTKTAAVRPSPATKTPFLSSFQKLVARFSVFSTPPPRPASALLSPESNREPLFSPSFQQKDVLLFEWWLMKTEKAYMGKRLAVGGFTKRSGAVGIFTSAPIIKCHDDYTLETADGISVRLQGPINKTRTFDNGFSLEVSVAFLFGFPTNWDTFIGESSGGKPTNQPEITFDPSSQKRTVLLKNWWLRRAEKGFDGNTLAVGGFNECGKAMRIFNSSPIIKRHDLCTLETADGITIRIQGFINKTRTLDNGFPLEACKIFFIGFPTTWTKFAILSTGDEPSHTETHVNTSISADWYEDFLENLPFGFPVSSENTNLENVPLSSKTSICDFAAVLLEAIRKSVARGSIPSSVHSPKGSHHLPAKKLCDDNSVQTDKVCGTNVTYAQTVRKDYEYHVVECTPTDRTEAFHSKADGCQINNLHVDGLPQEISVGHGKLDFIQEETLRNSKKCTGHALTTGHHDELVKICSTDVSLDFVIGEDSDKQERTVQKKDEKFNECSTGLTKPDNLQSEDHNLAKFSAKPVRRSKRLRLQEVGNVPGDFQDYSQFLSETNKMDCAKLALDGSKTFAASQPNETLVEGSPSSSLFSREDQIFRKSPAEPAVRKGARFELLTVGNVHGESQDYFELLNEANNENCANLTPEGPKISATTLLNDVLLQVRPSSPNLYGKTQEFVSSAKHASESDRSAPALDGSKTYATSLLSDTVLTEGIVAPTDSVPCPSAGVLSEENQDGHHYSNIMSSEIVSTSTACLWKSSNDQKTFSSDPTVGVLEETPSNSKALASPTLEKNRMRQCKKIKDNQTVRSRMTVEHNDSRNQQDFRNSEENMSISSASKSRRKASRQITSANKSLHIRTNYKTNNVGVSRDMGKPKCEGSRSAGYRTVWVSSYTDVHHAPLTRCKGIDSSFRTPEKLSIKRSRSGRLLLPTIDCSTRILYEADGSIAGTASVDGSIAKTLFQCKGSRTTRNGRKRKKPNNQ